MSSHHIIRDNQEPALAILSDSFDAETLLQLLEWGPVTCVAGPAAERIHSMGINIDALFFDKPDHASLFSQSQPDVELVKTGESHATQAIIAYLVKKGHHAINFLGPDDPALFRKIAAEHTSLKLVSFTERGKAFLSPGNYRKWYVSGTRIGIYPLHQSTYTVTGPWVTDGEGHILCTADGIIGIQSPGSLIIEEEL